MKMICYYVNYPAVRARISFLPFSKSQVFFFQVHVVADVRGHRGGAAADGRSDSAEEQPRSRGKLRLARRSTLRTVKIKACK